MNRQIRNTYTTEASVANAALADLKKDVFAPGPDGKVAIRTVSEGEYQGGPVANLTELYAIVSPIIGQNHFVISENAYGTWNGSSWYVPSLGAVNSIVAGSAISVSGPSGDVTVNARYDNTKGLDLSAGKLAVQVDGTSVGFDAFGKLKAVGLGTMAAETATDYVKQTDIGTMAAENAADYTNTAGLSTATVGKAGSITGGAIGEVLYQSAPDTTAKLAVGAAGKVLTSNGAGVAPTWESLPGGGGSGDMLKATYDPTNINSSAFNQDNMIDGTANKNYTATEKTKLAGIASGATANDTDANLKNRANHTGTQSADTVIDGTTNKVYTAAEKTKLAGISGTNTGDQTNITGNSGTTDAAKGLKTATTTVSIDGATAPTTGQVLTATSSTNATWQTPSAGGASVWAFAEYRGRSSVLTGSWTPGVFDEFSGINGGYSTDTMGTSLEVFGANKIFARATGTYFISFGGSGFRTGSYPVALALRKNGSSTVGAQVNFDSTTAVTLSYGVVVSLTAGDYIRLAASASGNPATGTFNMDVWWNMIRLT